MTRSIQCSLIAAFALIVLVVPAVADPAKDKKTSKKAKAEKTETIEDDAEVVVDTSMFVRLTKDRFVKGTPLDIAFIDMYIRGTKLTIPLEDVNGVRLGEEGQKGTIVTKDGEIYNGRIELPQLKLSVDWGNTTIQRGSLVSIDRSRDLHWQQRDTPNGSKWFLAPKFIESVQSNSYNAPTANMGVSVWQR